MASENPSGPGKRPLEDPEDSDEGQIESPKRPKQDPFETLSDSSSGASSSESEDESSSQSSSSGRKFQTLPLNLNYSNAAISAVIF